MKYQIEHIKFNWVLFSASSLLGVEWCRGQSMMYTFGYFPPWKIYPGSISFEYRDTKDGYYTKTCNLVFNFGP